jgi:hypothetical protein
MADQYYGKNARPGGGVFVLEDPFSASPRVTSLLTQADMPKRGKPRPGQPYGSFISLDVDYDGKTIAFAFTEAKKGIKYIDKHNGIFEWAPDACYHVFRSDADGKNVRQLTDGIYNEFDPCFLPDGGIVFVSERRRGQIRCSQRPDPCYTMHRMARDGSGIHALSYHDTNEWHPSVDNNGMIIYSRWDYVDRAPNIAHHLWITYPDGRDPRSLHGNYPRLLTDRTFAEMSMRAIPGSRRYVAVAVPHHGQAYGTLILIDQQVPDDGRMSQVKRVTPEVPIPEAELRTRKYKKDTPRPTEVYNMYGRGGEVYGTPWPLSEDLYICVYDPAARNYGIYVVDSFGNRELLYRDPKISCLDPIPLRGRPKPSALTRMTKYNADGSKGQATGTVAIMNIYESDFEWPPNTRVASLRVIQLFPRLTYMQWRPNIGAARQSLARGVLGTVPVEKDGSAYFEMPAGKHVYFQALDEDGIAIQSMRSGTYVHPGEQLSCIGCHEDKWRWKPPLSGKQPIALGRPPRKLQPDVSGSYPVLFPKLVQPVLDRKCVSCHVKEKKAPSLSSAKSRRSFGDSHDMKRKGGGTDLSWGWSDAMHTLAPLGNYQGGRANTVTLPYEKGGGARSIAGKVGARGSRLYAMLRKGHHDVELTEEEMHRITLWLDTNCVFFGAYRDIEKQLRGEVVMPLLE